MGKLFGTDGVRGIANTELTCELAMDLGRAAAVVLTEETHHRPKIIIGKDTRVSSDMLEASMLAGICSMGADAVVLGVVPTPAVAFLVKKLGADAGVMISASHNPVEYNGIKIFNTNGYKLSDELEEKIEEIVLNPEIKLDIKPGDGVGREIRRPDAVDLYIEHLKSTVDRDFEGLRIAVDCANGSASTIAPSLFKETDGEFELFNAHPDGFNINKDCGSTHIERLCQYVKDNGCDAGIAFDGDADRCLAVDEKGNVIDGDKLIAIFADYMKKHDKLKNNTAVVTIMSNFGFFRFADDKDIEVAKTAVGDRYVLEEMIKGGYSIGGEQTGHIIFLDHATTGDGELTALQFLSILKHTDKTASGLAKVMESYPQITVNVDMGGANKENILGQTDVKEAIQLAEGELADDGRVIVRASGTEPLIRIMVEGKSTKLITKLANDIAEVIKTHI